MIDLETSVELVHETSLFRVPEAIRRADGGSREVLRLMEESEKGRRDLGRQREGGKGELGMGECSREMGDGI